MTIRVLIVDDHAVLRDGLRSLLAAATDIEVVGEAADGHAAMREISALAPHVVLLDISMPGLNGTEALKLIKKKHEAVRVVMLSMHSSSEYVFRALHAGADGYLLKEAAGKEVVAAVRSVFAGRSYISSAVPVAYLDGATAHKASPVQRLSARELQVLQLVVEGKSSREVAEIVHLSPKSVATYRSRIMKKLGVADTTGLVKFALQHGLTGAQ
jgi:DNA-binding NarL/FixJ family response regulator